MMKLSCAIIFVCVFVTAHFSQTLTAIESELVQRLDNISKYGTYGGNYDEKVYSENEALKAKLLSYGRRADVLQYPFSRLKGKMQVTTSKDGNLRIYSWDEQTGGTMHDHDSVFQYRGRGGKVFTWAARNEGEDIGGFYHEIFQLDSAAGPVYLGVLTFIGSTSLAGQSINVFMIRGETLDRNLKLIRTASGLKNFISFSYDFFSVVDRPERPIKLFKFDAANRSLTFPVVIEDEKTPQGRVTDKLIKYRFDGKYFVKVG